MSGSLSHSQGHMLASGAWVSLPEIAPQLRVGSMIASTGSSATFFTFRVGADMSSGGI